MNQSINCSDPYFTDAVIHPVGLEALHLALAATGLVGNGLVFLVFFRLPRLRTKTTNIFLFNLAVADFCSSAFVAGRPYVFGLDPDSPFWREFVCRFFKSDFPLWTCVTASIYNLILVTVDRYLCVVKPFLYRRYFTAARIRLMVVTCWTFSAILETFCFYSTRVNACGSCEIHWPSKSLQLTCTIATFLFTYLLPTIVMLFAYGNIVRTLKTRERALQNHRQPVAAGNLLRARRNIVRMLQILVLLFGILWAPCQILFLYLSIPGASTELTQRGFSIILMVGFLNCVVNPAVYPFKNPQFKSALLATVCCRRTGAVVPVSDVNASELILGGGGGDCRVPLAARLSAVPLAPDRPSPPRQSEEDPPPVDLPNQPVHQTRNTSDVLDE